MQRDRETGREGGLGPHRAESETMNGNRCQCSQQRVHPGAHRRRRTRDAIAECEKRRIADGVVRRVGDFAVRPQPGRAETLGDPHRDGVVVSAVGRRGKSTSRPQDHPCASNERDRAGHQIAAMPLRPRCFVHGSSGLGKRAEQPVVLQSQNDFAHRKAHHVGVRADDPAHRERANALDGVAASLVRSFAARDVAFDLFLVERSKLDACAHGLGMYERGRTTTLRPPQSKAGTDFVSAPREPSDHLLCVVRIFGLSENLIVDENDRVSGQDHAGYARSFVCRDALQLALCHSLEVRGGALSFYPPLVHIGDHHEQGDAEAIEQVFSAGRCRAETEWGGRADHPREDRTLRARAQVSLQGSARTVGSWQDQITIGKRIVGLTQDTARPSEYPLFGPNLAATPGQLRSVGSKLCLSGQSEWPHSRPGDRSGSENQ